MKKILFKLFTTVALSTILFFNASAQLMAVNLKSNLPQLQAFVANFGNLDEEKTKEERAAVKISRANSRALKNFSSNFKNETDVKWTNEAECITASFKKDGVQTFSVYNKQGEWLRNMSYYDESKMPKDVRTLIKRSEFFDYKITGVQEIKERDVLFYIVHIEEGRNYKQICAYDGQFEVIKEYKMSL